MHGLMDQGQWEKGGDWGGSRMGLGCFDGFGGGGVSFPGGRAGLPGLEVTLI